MYKPRNMAKQLSLNKNWKKEKPQTAVIKESRVNNNPVLAVNISKNLHLIKYIASSNLGLKVSLMIPKCLKWELKQQKHIYFLSPVLPPYKFSANYQKLLINEKVSFIYWKISFWLSHF